MINKIQQKRLKGKGAVPTTSQLSEGELAISLPDKKLFTNDGSKIVEVSAGRYPKIKKFGGAYYYGGYILIGDDDRCYFSSKNHGAYQNLGSWWSGAVTGVTEALLPQIPVIDCGVIGNHTSYALLENGDLFAWGHNLHGVTGSGGTTAVHHPALIHSNVLRVEEDMAVGYDGNSSHTYIQLKDKSWKTFGYDWNDLITGVKNTSLDTTKPVPVVNPAGTKIVRIFNTGCNECLVFCLCDNGKIYAIGSDFYGATGTGAGATVTSWKPVLNIPTIPKNIVDDPYSEQSLEYVQLNYGWGFRTNNPYARPVGLLVINKELFAWGMNEYMALGTGNTVLHSTPVKITTVKNIKKIVSSQSGSTSAVHALTHDGKVWSWGYGYYGGVGNGGFSNSAPTITQTDVVDIWGSGGGHSYGHCKGFLLKKKDGSIWGCGSNEHGSLCLKRGWYDARVNAWTETIWSWVGDIREMIIVNNSGGGNDTVWGITDAGEMYFAGNDVGGGNCGPMRKGTLNNSVRTEAPLRIF